MKISNDTKDAFLLEEYKFTIQRIKDHEERRYQLLILNVTGFAAIFGLSGQIIAPVVPFALLSLLIICALGYSANQHDQLLNTAFIVEKFEKGLGFLDHDSGYLFRSQHALTTPQSKFSRQFRLAVGKIVGFVLDSFTLLTVISLIGGFLLSANFILSLLKGNKFCLGIGYLVIVMIGHLFVIRDISRRRRQNMEFYLESWRTYFSQEKPKNV